MNTPMSNSDKATANNLMCTTADSLNMLRWRWLDERKYEDWGAYAQAIQKRVGKTFVKATKRPFGFVAKLTGSTIQVSVTANKMRWTRIPG